MSESTDDLSRQGVMSWFADQAARYEIPECAAIVIVSRDKDGAERIHTDFIKARGVSGLVVKGAAHILASDVEAWYRGSSVLAPDEAEE